MSDGGKGSTQRPTDKAAYDEGYERIFRRSMDPLNGANVLRYSKTIFRENGDGTMTYIGRADGKCEEVKND